MHKNLAHHYYNMTHNSALGFNQYNTNFTDNKAMGTEMLQW